MGSRFAQSTGKVKRLNIVHIKAEDTFELHDLTRVLYLPLSFSLVIKVDNLIILRHLRDVAVRVGQVSHFTVSKINLNNLVIVVIFNFKLFRPLI